MIDVQTGYDGPLKPRAPSGRILVVDDSANLRKSTAMLLTLSGFEVTTATNGEEALEIALMAESMGSGFHMVLMDIQMPIMDGIETTRMFRHAGFTGPIIACSGSIVDGIEKRCLGAGCDVFLQKPVELDSVQDVFQRCLAPQPPAAGDRHA